MTVVSLRKKKEKSKKTASKTPNLQHWLINKLRRISYQWPPRKAAKIKARVERGKYLCSSCGGIFGPKEINMDHTIPVIDPHTGFTTWDDFINRLLCDEKNFSVKCKTCHGIKSSMENEIRRQVKQKDNPGDDI